MLKIRDEQIRALGLHSKEQFVHRAMAHLREHFPDPFQTMRHSDLRSLCDHGIERAGSYGIESQRDLCKYLSLMVVFGRDFDTDRRLPWAVETLNDPTLGPMLRLNRVYADALEHADEGRGLEPGAGEA